MQKCLENNLKRKSVLKMFRNFFYMFTLFLSRLNIFLHYFENISTLIFYIFYTSENVVLKNFFIQRKNGNSTFFCKFFTFYVVNKVLHLHF